MDQIETVKHFDFSQLDANTAHWLRSHTHVIQDEIVNVASSIVKIGKTLMEVKNRLPYGVWQSWADYYLPWSQRKTDHMIRAARVFGTNGKEIDSFTPSALYALASPDVAPAVRSQVMEIAGRGELLTHSRVKSIIEIHKPVPPDRTPAEPIRPAPSDRKSAKDKPDNRIAIDTERHAESWLHVLDCLSRYGTIHITVNEESEDDDHPLFVFVGYPKDDAEPIRRECRLNPAFAFAAMVDDEPTKKCITCKKHLALERYSSDSNSADGRTNRCRACEQRRQKVKRREKANRKTVKLATSSPAPQLAAV